MFDAARLDEVMAEFSRLRIAVLGDYFLDRYLITDPALSEVSLETGLEARQVVAVRSSPGAAGTVTNNLAALGVGHITAIGVVGADGEGYELLSGLSATGVDTSCLVKRSDLFTPTYIKPMVRDANGERELERLDIQNRAPMPADVESTVLARLERLLCQGSVDAVIVADQVVERNHGVVTDRVRWSLAGLAEAHRRVCFFADSRSRIGEYRAVCLKPNAHEAARAVGRFAGKVVDRAQAAEWGRELRARTGRPVFVTLGEQGMLACDDDVAFIPSVHVAPPVDIVGAGDSASAGIVTALASGASISEAGLMGNLCASVTVRKLGTTGTASPDELRSAFAEWQAAQTNAPNRG